jgi:uncharacterized protein (TIGR02466 family)
MTSSTQTFTMPKVDREDDDAVKKATAGGPALNADLDELERLGQYVEAERIYRELLSERPDDSALLHNFGLLLRLHGGFAEAEKMIRRAIEIDPTKPALHNSLGVVLRGAGQIQESEACYRRALELWDAYPEAHYNLGVLLESAERFDEALNSYLVAVQLKPDYVAALTRTGAVLNQRGSSEEACKYLRRACAVDSQSFDAHYYLGWALSSLRAHDEALAELATAAAIRPESLELAVARAHALQNAGRLDEALDENWRLLELQPERIATHEEINKLAWMAGRKDFYLRSFAFARERVGDLPALLSLEAAFHLRGGEFVQAESLTRRACALNPARGDAMGLLARSLVGQGRVAESFDWFARAIEVEPDAAIHYQEFGFALMRVGMAAEALEIFKRAVARDLGDALVIAGMALAFRALGDARYQQLVDFSKYVRVYDLRGADGQSGELFNRDLAAELDTLHLATVAPIDQTLRGGTQTTEHLFAVKSPAIQRLKSQFDAAVASYIGDLPDDAWHPLAGLKTQRLDYSGSWSCRLKSGGFHANHVHPKGLISSVYYVRLPKEQHSDEHEGWLKFGQSNLALGEWDSPDQMVKPVVGRLVLFPSFFWHGTIPFKDDGDRLTVAFDVVAEADKS